jgi:hypothetical protein
MVLLFNVSSNPFIQDGAKIMKHNPRDIHCNIPENNILKREEPADVKSYQYMALGDIVGGIWNCL